MYLLHYDAGCRLPKLAEVQHGVVAVHEVAAALGARGRSGSALMRGLLADRDAAYVAPESRLEEVVRRLLAS